MRAATFVHAVLLVFAAAWTSAAYSQDEEKARYKEENKRCTLRDAHAAYLKAVKKDQDPKLAIEAVRTACRMVIAGSSCSVQEFFEVMFTQPSFNELKKQCKS